jgi:haloalkane dehalogenase
MVIIPTELKQEYPFQSHFLKLLKNKLHYLDEGNGEVILMLHGNPTWSFFYRNLVKYFSKNFRVIVPDHIGCGLSDKPDAKNFSYTLKDHIENIEKLVTTLELKDITLVVHDWGGAIGMGLATRHPELIKKIVIMNTAAFVSPDIPTRINILRNPIGEWAIQAFNGFAYPATFMSTTKKLSPLIKKGFTLPYYDFNSRIATAKFVQDIPMTESHQSFQTLKTIENNLSTLKVPVLLLWGEKDFCFTTNFLKRWQQFFPNAKTRLLPNAGHYLIEDEEQEVIKEIDEFIKG